jgi:hypothetical protein
MRAAVFVANLAISNFLATLAPVFLTIEWFLNLWCVHLKKRNSVTSFKDNYIC